MLTEQDKTGILDILLQGKWSFVTLFLVDQSGRKEWWAENDIFGQLERDEKYYPLGPEDQDPKTSLLLGHLASAIREATDAGWYRLIIRFYGAKPKEQCEKSIMLQSKGSARGGDSLDVRAGKSLVEVTESLAKSNAAMLPQVASAYRGTTEALQSTIQHLQERGKEDQKEIRELRQENREMAKRIRELEAEAGGWALADKLLAPENLGGQATLVSGLKATYGALQAKSWPEALRKFGEEGGKALDELMAQAPQLAAQEGTPDA